MTASADGREIDFHRKRSLNSDISELHAGDHVRLVEAVRESRPHASAMQVADKHHLAQGVTMGQIIQAQR